MVVNLGDVLLPEDVLPEDVLLLLKLELEFVMVLHKKGSIRHEGGELGDHGHFRRELGIPVVF